MPHYVDVAVVRIQRYLARTPTLVGRRGASSAVAAAADALPESALLDGLAQVNEEAGRVDGVLSLVLRDPADQAEVAARVLAFLRKRLPGAEFQVAQGSGENYLQAYAEQIRPARERGDVRNDFPAGAEFPLAALCEICRVDPAVDSVPLNPEDGSRIACADCKMRHSKEIRKQGRTAETRLAERVGATATATGFNQLAELTDPAHGPQHLATLHADGNRVGAFFAALAEAGVPDRTRAVSELSTCTFDAMAAATCAVRRPTDPVLCVVPHLVGGDDVLVTLPADRAWRFAVEFMRDFGDRVARLARRLGGAEGIEPPTMSVGMVFARRDHPFALVTEEAEHALRAAKAAGAGRRAWVRFVDLVTDGPQGPGRPVSLSALRTHRDALHRLVALPRSHRVQLAEQLRTGGEVTALTLARRTGHAEAIAPFLLANPRRADRSKLDRHDEVDVDLDQALRIARWWR